ncbi:hypothetical protein L596_008909 [Steinernema carpocapsae]|uniref:Uncharacterized protein n=1 Tax=Steinernema carpocapsae TaxID=34508 RepID=A0A4U5PE09_STECR|nr:hypothetical protein L596_008909 [Steinernema carpocapsae]
MVKNFEELLFRLGKPCVLAYSPTHFQSPFCIQLQWDYGALFELLTGFNWEVDQLCQYQCSVPNDYADKVKEYIGKLLDILNNL